MIKLKKTSQDGSFSIGLLVESQGRFVSFSEFKGNIKSLGEAKSTEAPLSEPEATAALELYRGPDDPRLPEDVKKVTIGKREDFVDMFNSCFWWYRKKDDAEYDENQSKDVNQINYCTRMAYDAMNGKSDGGYQESAGAEETGAMMPMAPEDHPWNGPAAAKRMVTLATNTKGEMDWGQYAKGFAWHDKTDAKKLGSYKLPFCDVVDGKLKVVKAGVIAAGNACMGARGGVDIPEADMPAVKSKLMKQYHRFGMKAPWEEKTKAFREQLVLEGGKVAYRITEKFLGVVIPRSTQEGASDSEDTPVVIIEKGWSLNERYYTDQALKDIAGFVNEEKPGFMNHGSTFNRDPRDWAIMVHSAEATSSRVEAKMHVFNEPDGPFLRERIAVAPHLFGGSIDAFVVMEDGVMEGKEGEVVQEVVELNCWDIVMFPGAGGAVLPSKESAPVPSQSTPEGRETMDLATLKKDHPALYQLVINEGKELLKAEMQTKLDAATTEAAKAKETAEKTAAENVTLKATVDLFETAKKKTEYAAEVDKLIGTELAKDQQSANFRAILIDLGPEGMETAKKLVADRKEALSSTGTPKKVGTDPKQEQKTEEAKSEADELKAWASKKGRKVA